MVKKRHGRHKPLFWGNANTLPLIVIQFYQFYIFCRCHVSFILAYSIFLLFFFYYCHWDQQILSFEFRLVFSQSHEFICCMTGLSSLTKSRTHVSFDPKFLEANCLMKVNKNHGLLLHDLFTIIPPIYSLNIINLWIIIVDWHCEF